MYKQRGQITQTWPTFTLSIMFVPPTIGYNLLITHDKTLILIAHRFVDEFLMDVALQILQASCNKEKRTQYARYRPYDEEHTHVCLSFVGFLQKPFKWVLNVYSKMTYKNTNVSNAEWSKTIPCNKLMSTCYWCLDFDTLTTCGTHVRYDWCHLANSDDNVCKSFELHLITCSFLSKQLSRLSPIRKSSHPNPLKCPERPLVDVDQ